jgi:hemolysin III
MVVEAQAVGGRSLERMSAPVRSMKVKPRLRGIPDVIALVGFVPAAVALMVSAKPGLATLAAVIYGSALVALFAVSGTYHTPHWPLRIRLFWRRLDHSMIYALLVGCYTPVCLLVLPETSGRALLGAVAILAVLGFLKSFLWHNSPRALNAGIYVILGHLIVPFLGEVYAGMPEGVYMLGLGGVLYATGALIYVKRWPNPIPHLFGYHEVFHVFVVAAAASHYTAFWWLLVG